MRNILNISLYKKTTVAFGYNELWLPAAAGSLYLCIAGSSKGQHRVGDNYPTHSYDNAMYLDCFCFNFIKLTCLEVIIQCGQS